MPYAELVNYDEHDSEHCEQRQEGALQGLALKAKILHRCSILTRSRSRLIQSLQSLPTITVSYTRIVGATSDATTGSIIITLTEHTMYAKGSLRTYTIGWIGRDP